MPGTIIGDGSSERMEARWGSMVVVEGDLFAVDGLEGGGVGRRRRSLRSLPSGGGRQWLGEGGTHVEKNGLLGDLMRETVEL